MYLQQTVLQLVALVHHGDDVVIAQLEEDERDALAHLEVARLHRLLRQWLHLRDARQHLVDHRLVLRHQVVPVQHLLQRAAAHLEQVRRVDRLRVRRCGWGNVEERGQDAGGRQLLGREAVQRHPRLEAGEDHLLRLMGGGRAYHDGYVLDVGAEEAVDEPQDCGGAARHVLDLLLALLLENRHLKIRKGK